MATIPRNYVQQIADAIESHDRQRVAAGKAGVCRMAAYYRDNGYTPFRFRCDLRRASVPRSLFNEMHDTLPNVTDAALDTAVRSALRVVMAGDSWATSQPLKR